MLRLVRRGDRHDPRDLTVSFRLEGDFEPAFIDGLAETVVAAFDRPAGTAAGSDWTCPAAWSQCAVRRERAA